MTTASLAPLGLNASPSTAPDPHSSFAIKTPPLEAFGPRVHNETVPSLLLLAIRQVAVLWEPELEFERSGPELTPGCMLVDPNAEQPVGQKLTAVTPREWPSKHAICTSHRVSTGLESGEAGA